MQQELARRNLSLKMFDCYRPVRAVADMVAWSRDGKETVAGKRYNPAFRKADLFRLGYIATHSRHSTGAALDLTLSSLRRTIRRASIPPGAIPTAPRRRKLAPGGQRGHGHRLRLFRRQGPWRRTSPRRAAKMADMLVAAMARQGFVDYSKEWWHFSLPGAGGPAYDFPI